MASKKRVLKYTKSGALSLPAGHPFATPAEPSAPAVALEAPKVVVPAPAKKNSTRKKKTVKK